MTRFRQHYEFWLAHSVRTAVGASASYAIAKLTKLPEPFWAAVITLFVMHSTLGSSCPPSRARIIGAALGSAAAGLVATYFHPTVLVYGISVLVVGLLCGLLKLDRNAYRFAGIALTIVMLIARPAAPWLVAVQRFAEVALGIAVGLVVTAAWPEPELNVDG